MFGPSSLNSQIVGVPLVMTRTLFATVDGVVKYERLGRDRKKVSVYPPEASGAGRA